MSCQISIIVPTFKRQASLKRLLESIARQSWPRETLEVIIVDDQSGESLNGVVQEFSNAYAVRWMTSEIKGRPGARNAGAEAANGDMLIFVDDDMELQAGFIDGHVKAHEEFPNCVVSGRIVSARNSTIIWNILLDERFDLHEKHVAKSPDNLEFTCVFTGNLSLKRDIFRKLGGFDEVTFTYYGGEDFDFGIRCCKAGITIVHAHFAVARHFERDVNRRNFAEKTRWAAASMIVLLNKHKKLVLSEPSLAGFPCPLPGVYKPARKTWKAIIWKIFLFPPFLEIGLWMAEFLWRYLNLDIARKIARICSAYYYQRYLCAATKKIWQPPALGN